MKLLGIFLLLFVLSIGFDFLIDVIMGSGIRGVLTNIKNPFFLMTPPEYFIILVLFLLLLKNTIFSTFKKPKQKD